MKLLVRVFLAIIFLVLAAVFAAPFLIPSGWIAEKVAEQVKAHTGRTLSFSPDTSLSFFPDISLVLKDARLSNPPDMPEGFVVAMDSLQLKVGLKPLFSRKVDVQEFVLEKPVVNLLVTSEGKSNWRFASISGGAASGGGNQAIDELKPTEISIGPIKIVRGRMRYLDERSGSALKVDEINMGISVSRLDGPAGLDGNLIWNGEKIALNFKADEAAALAEDRVTNVSFTVSAAPLALSYAGRLSLSNGLRLAGAVNAKTPSLRALAKWAGSPLAPGRGAGRVFG